MSGPLATVRTPNGNLLELHHEGGVFSILTYKEPDSECPLTEDEAREWYALTSQLGGRQHKRFPEKVTG